MANKSLRKLLVDTPRSIGGRLRARRWQIFTETFPDIERMRVLDLGGTVQAWQRAPRHPKHVTVLNLLEPGTTEESWLRPVTGDACEPPSHLGEESFDLIYSNSLLEHVGGHARRLQLADIVHEWAPRHWIQTPDRAFPIEPHFLFPGFQILSVPMQAWIIQRWPLVHTRPRDQESAMEIVQWTELVGARQMEAYFPTSTLIRERVLGLPKSLIAVRTT